MKQKETNLFKIDGKLFVKGITCCNVLSKNKDEYVLECKILQSGEKIYRYFSGDNYLVKDGKKLWLSENAKAQVQNDIDDFCKMVDAVEVYGSEFTVIDVCDDETYGLRLFYRKNGINDYEVIKEFYENGDCRYEHIKRVGIEYFFLSGRFFPSFFRHRRA